MTLVQESENLAKWLVEKLDGLGFPSHDSTLVAAGCGLRADPKDHEKLSPRSSSKKEDLKIEHFENADGPLRLVTPVQAVAPYKGSPDETERALARVIHIANRGVAHSTVGSSAIRTIFGSARSQVAVFKRSSPTTSTCHSVSKHPPNGSRCEGETPVEEGAAQQSVAPDAPHR